MTPEILFLLKDRIEAIRLNSPLTKKRNNPGTKKFWKGEFCRISTVIPIPVPSGLIIIEQPAGMAPNATTAWEMLKIVNNFPFIIDFV